MSGESATDAGGNSQSILVRQGSRTKSRKTVRFDLNRNMSRGPEDIQLQKWPGVMANDFKHQKISNIFADLHKMEFDLASKLPAYRQGQGIAPRNTSALEIRKQPKVIVRISKNPQFFNKEPENPQETPNTSFHKFETPVPPPQNSEIPKERLISMKEELRKSASAFNIKSSRSISNYSRSLETITKQSSIFIDKVKKTQSQTELKDIMSEEIEQNKSRSGKRSMNSQDFGQILLGNNHSHRKHVKQMEGLRLNVSNNRNLEQTSIGFYDKDLSENQYSSTRKAQPLLSLNRTNGGQKSVSDLYNSRMNGRSQYYRKNVLTQETPKISARGKLYLNLVISENQYRNILNPAGHNLGGVFVLARQSQYF